MVSDKKKKKVAFFLCRCKNGGKLREKKGDVKGDVKAENVCRNRAVGIRVGIACPMGGTHICLRNQVVADVILNISSLLTRHRGDIGLVGSVGVCFAGFLGEVLGTGSSSITLAVISFARHDFYISVGCACLERKKTPDCGLIVADVDVLAVCMRACKGSYPELRRPCDLLAWFGGAGSE